MYFFKVSHGDGSQIAAPPFAQQRGVEPDSDVEEPGIGLEPWDPRGGTDAVEGVQYVVARLKHRQCRLGRELERLLHREGAERLGRISTPHGPSNPVSRSRATASARHTDCRHT